MNFSNHNNDLHISIVLHVLKHTSSINIIIVSLLDERSCKLLIFLWKNYFFHEFSYFVDCFSKATSPNLANSSWVSHRYDNNYEGPQMYLGFVLFISVILMGTLNLMMMFVYWVKSPFLEYYRSHQVKKG